jgi:uncharacterized protein YndB with AHSA1/START domain
MGNSRSVLEEGLLEISLTRRVSAPPSIVFRAWTDPNQLAEWWEPKGFANPVCEADSRVGGVIRIHMRDGVAHPMTGRFLEIDQPHRLVFMASPLDNSGIRVAEVLNTVTFVEFNRGTEIALVARVINATAASAQAISGMSQGWSQSLDRLATYVAQL